MPLSRFDARSKRDIRHWRSSLVASSALLFASPLFAQAVPPPTGKAAELTLPHGAHVDLPADWTFVPKGEGFDIVSPDIDTSVAMLDVGKAVDARAAVAAAWLRLGATPSYPDATEMPEFLERGWDEIRSFDYRIPASAKRVERAIAYRLGDAWTVEIVTGTQANVNRRMSAISQLGEGLTARGYTPENLASKHAHPLDAARLSELRRFVRESMEKLGIPGVGLAFVEKDRILYEGGIGVRRLGRPATVDAHTRFLVASNTKGMTTLLLAELVDQGLVGWNEPVVSAYPSFRLGDDTTTKRVRFRDLVCACTGLPRKDMELLFKTMDSTPASDTFVQLAATRPTTDFGKVYQYNNMIVAAAGYIAGHLLYPGAEVGAAYDRAMTERVFTPLGMTDTTFNFAAALAGDHASPHGMDLAGHPAVGNMGYNTGIIPYRPAAGAWSSAHDMIRYVRNELQLGRLPDGRMLLTPANLLVRRERGVPTTPGQYYGMGIQVDTRPGIDIFYHGGSAAGYKSDIVFIPAAGVGATILTNASAGRQLYPAFRRKLVEVLYGARKEADSMVAISADRNAIEHAEWRKGLTVPPDPQLLARLAGNYESPGLGRITVVRENGTLLFDFGEWRSHMATRHNADGTVSFATIDPDVDEFEFELAGAGDASSLTLRDEQHAYVYRPVDMSHSSMAN